MKIKNINKRSQIFSTFSNFYHKRRFSFFALFIYTLSLLIFGIFIHKSGFFQETLKPLIRQNINIIPKLVSGMLAKPERLTIDIKHTDFQKLAFQRELALSSGVLFQGDDDFVPARIRYKDKSIKVKLRLKGDLTDHLEGDKWSYRVKVRNENNIFGMKLFSIHHPKTRNYINEWIYHQTLKREGLIGLRYKFITVTLNGKDLGVYALEEHFEKRLIEYSCHREGPIIRFDENLMWQERSQQKISFRDAARNGNGAYLSSDIDGFQTGKWTSNPSSYSLYLDAIHLLESFRRGLIKTSEAFDAKKLATYFAVSDIMGAQHGTLWHNSRFYYNPITSKFEIIGFDGDTGRPLESISAVKEGNYIGNEDALIQDKYYAMIFNDPLFFKEYIGALERVSESSYLDNLFLELEDELKENLNILYSEFPKYEFSNDVFYRNLEYIKTVLNPIKGIHAHYNNCNNKGIELDIGNIHSLPIEVVNITYKDYLAFPPSQDIILPANVLSKPVNYLNCLFVLPENIVWSDSMNPELKVNYKILGSDQIRNATVLNWPYLNDSFINNDFMRQPANIEKFNFLVIDEVSKEILIKPGRWTLNQNMIIPNGYTVICKDRTQLNLINSAKILSYSPLEFLGSKDEPIFIYSADTTGQGIVVMNSKKKSVLDYVIFNNLSNPKQRSWELTGAVTFYESPVLISHSEFLNNRSEDALNIIRSEFAIENSHFRNIYSDAFDADFTQGKIKDTSFLNCGNDGVDVSGSVIEIQNVTIDHAGDKGLSVGENSMMRANNIEIKNSEIAVASKDQSEIHLNVIKLSDCKIGLTLFQKKPEFEAAVIDVVNLNMNNIEIPFLVEEKSTLVVNGVKIPPSRKNVKEILYGVEFGKSSR